MSNKKSSKFAVGAILAAGIGYLAGILTAPKSGKETRKEVKNTAVATKLELEKELKTVHAELRKNLKDAQNLVKTEKKELKKDLDAFIVKAKKAESKVKETLSALHEGTADSPELNSALFDAKAAIRHYKKYLTNK